MYRVALISVFILIAGLPLLSFSQPLTGTRTIGGAGANYATFSAAISALNTNGVGSGGVTFNVNAGVYSEQVVVSAVTGASNSSPIIFRKVSGGVTISPVTTSGTNTGVKLVGCRWVTFDGIDIADTSAGSTYLDLGYWITNSSDSTGAQYNTIKNASIRLRKDFATYGVYQFYNYPPSSQSGSQSNNRYLNLKISKVRYGMYLYSSNAFPDSNLEIGSDSVGTGYSKRFTIGGLVNDTIGAGRNGYGIYTWKCGSVRIHDLDITNIITTAGYSAFGIFAYYPYGMNSIYNCRVFNLSGVGSTAYPSVWGIYVHNDDNYPNRIYNNMVYGLKATSTATASNSYFVYGIYAYNNANIDYNTILLDQGTNVNCSTSAVNLYNGTDTLRNNIFANLTSGQSSPAAHVGIYTTSITSLYSDYNAFDIPDTANGYIGYNLGLRSNLRLWRQSASNIDNNSVTGNPRFFSAVAPYNPHILANQSASILESSGYPISYITTDIDGDTRNAVTPDIGADEGSFLTTTAPQRPVLITPVNGATGVSNPIILAWHHSLLTNNTDVYVSMNYSDVESMAASARIASAITDTFYNAGSLLTASTVYYWRVVARNSSTGELNASLIWNFMTHIQPLSGIKTIGGASPDYADFRTALGTLALSGVGPSGITFRIRSGTYSDSSEDISAIGSATGPVIFRPDSGATVTLNFSGTSLYPAGIRFIHARYVTFDGSWPSDSVGKHWTIGCDNTLTSCIWFSDSCGNNTIKNCVVDAGIRTTPSSQALKIGNPVATARPITNNRFLHCNFNGGYYGIYAVGIGNGTIDSTLIQYCNVMNFQGTGISAAFGNAFTIFHNHIYDTVQVVSSNSVGLSFGNAVNNSLIDANTIGPLICTNNGGSGASLTGLSAQGGNVYSNNMIYLGQTTTGQVVGISSNNPNQGGLGGGKFLFNTVSISGATLTNTNGAYSSAYMNYSSGAFSDTLWGNIFQNTRTGGLANNFHTCMYFYNTSATFYSNYNLFWLNAGDSLGDISYLARITSSTYNSLVEWTLQDQSSFFEAAPFISDSNLHIRNDISTVIESGAPHHWQVVTDFDGQPRTNIACDVGADEGAFRGLSTGTLQGAVYDSSATHPPLSGVQVQAGRYITTTDSNGHYSLEVRTGSYLLRISKHCFASDSALVSVDSGDVVATDFYMLHPELTLVPAQQTIQFVSEPGQINSTTLVIHNTGNADLHWQGTSTITNYDLDSRRNDTGIGQIRPPSIARVWGPDAAGDSAIDIAEPNYPGYLHFRELRGLGTRVVGGTDSTVRISLSGSTFYYYSEAFDSIWVNTNGYVQFADSTVFGSQTRTSHSLPDTLMPNGVFVLHRYLNATVFKYFDAVQQIFYVQWVGTIGGFPSDSAVFQLQLHCRNDVLAFLYQNVETSHLTAAIGIENGYGFGNRFIQCYYNTAAPFPHNLNGYGIAFRDSIGWMDWLSLSPREGTLAPNQLAEIFVQAIVDSNATIPSVLNGHIDLTSDACPSPISIAVVTTITSVKGENGSLPAHYKLYQNYPNPFNPVTEIRFDLKKDGMTRLQIYDVLGRQVSELVNQKLSAGYHVLRFDGSRFATGVYFYRIESGSFNDVKKMVLVK